MSGVVTEEPSIITDHRCGFVPEKRLRTSRTADGLTAAEEKKFNPERVARFIRPVVNSTPRGSTRRPGHTIYRIYMIGPG